MTGCLEYGDRSIVHPRSRKSDLLGRRSRFSARRSSSDGAAENAFQVLDEIRVSERPTCRLRPPYGRERRVVGARFDQVGETVYPFQDRGDCPAR